VAVAILFVVNGMVLGSWLPRLPELRDRLGLDLAGVGVVLGVGGLGGLLGSALSGVVIGRVGPRRAAVGPALGLLASLPLVAFAPSAVTLALVVAAAGLLDAVADVGMNALGVRVEEARGRSIMNRLHALWSVGSFGGSAVSAGALASGVGLRPQLLAIAAAGLMAVTVAARGLPDPAPRPRPRPRLSPVLALAVAGFAVALVEGAPVDWSAIFLTDVIGASPTTAGTGFLVYMGGMLTGRAAGDTLVDRLGLRRVLPVGLAMVAAGLAVVLVSNGPVGGLAGLALWGLGVSVVFPLFYRIAGAHRSLGEGAGLAALTVGSRIGFLSGPAAIGATAALTSLPLALGMMVGVGLIGAVVTIARTLSE
jgi:predicted MFS family arabinose efflux permease